MPSSDSTTNGGDITKAQQEADELADDENEQQNGASGEEGRNDVQQMEREFCEQCAVTTDLKEAKQQQSISSSKELELENKLLQAELREQKVVAERNELVAKITKMEREKKEEKAREKKEKEEKEFAAQVRNANLMDFLITKARFLENWWDTEHCHADLKVIEPRSSTVYYQGDGRDWRSVLACNAISRTDFCYFEVKADDDVSIGLATREISLDKAVGWHMNSYGYSSSGWFWSDNNGRKKRMPTFSAGDYVGCGFNFATRRLFFTKNGQRLINVDWVIPQSLAIDSLFPCVSLGRSGEKIVANFGPNFKFDT